VELPEGGGRVTNLVEALDPKRRDELAAAEVADGVAAGEGGRGEDGRVGLAQAGDEVDLLEGLLDDCV
jgi:hypothetical protein